MPAIRPLTRPGSRRFFLIALFALALAGAGIRPATPATAQETGGATRPADAGPLVVRLKSGEAIVASRCFVDQRYKTLRLTVSAGERAVSFTDVEAIVADGEDVTGAIMGGRYAPDAPAATAPEPAPAPAAAAGDSAIAPDRALAAPPAAPAPRETWLPADNEAFRRARRPTWKGAVRAAANYGFPVGDYYEGTQGGPGWEGDVLFALSHQFALRLSVSRSGMDWDDDMVLYSLDPDIEVLSQALGMRVLRYYAAAHAYWHLDRERRDRSMLYAYFGLGAIHHKLTADVTLRRISTGDVFADSMGDDFTKFLITSGGGLMKTLSRSLAVDVALSVDQVWVGEEAGDVSVYGPGKVAWIFDFKLGLVTFF